MSRRQLRTLVDEITGKKLRVENKKNEYKKYFENKLNTSYEYDWDSYINVSTPMRIKCLEHGWWHTTAPSSHRGGTICPKCAILKNKKNKRLSISDVKKRFFNTHRNFYAYDWTSYIDTRNPITIICPLHGNFEQTPTNHWNGSGCSKCYYEKMSKSNTLDIEIVKKRFFEKHGNFYTYDWYTYKNFTTKMIIICHVHGKFKQTPRNHSDGNGCPKCIGQSLTVLETIHEFIDEHGDIFFYDESTYINQTTKMNMYCLEHGLFMLEPYLHRLGGGCPKCKNKSKGESKIYNYLDLKNIKFEEQKMFSDCRYKKPLRFDFYLPEFNICIEFDGIQHYKFNTYFHKNKQEFEEQQLRDKIKDDYCEENYIKLIRISYTERDNIREILKENINGSK